MAPHDHAAHTHAVRADADAGKLALALGLLVVFMLGEVTVGILGHSLALLSDAAHMLTDAAALALSLLAIRLAARPAEGSMTYGYKRVEILSAQFNGATLLVLGGLIVFGAIGRLVDPPGVDGAAVLAVAVVGIFVNAAATYTLSKANRRSMNVEGAFQHLLTDLVAFVFTAVAGAVILTTGFERADGIASVLIAAVMLRAAYSLLRDSGRVFLEAAPAGMDPNVIGHAMAAVDGVVEVHDLHVWEVTSGFPALSAHVLVGAESDCHEVRFRLDAALQQRFAIDHVTLQVDHQHSALIAIEATPQSGAVDPRTPVEPRGRPGA
ncbi:MAG: cation diffusion facilitator family transporter [Solirubrobacteraceae bacterium]